MTDKSYERSKYLVVGAVICIIALLFPRSASNNYKYNLGSKWTYEDLYSSIEFNIEKSDDDLKVERSELRESSPLVIKSIGKSTTDLTNELFIMLAQDDLSSEQNTALTSFISDAYNRGILDDNVIKRSEQRLYKRKSKRLREVDLEDLQTQSQFYSNLQIRLKAMGKRLPIDMSRVDIPASLEIDKTASDNFLEEQLTKVKTVKGKVNKGDLLAAKGAIITESGYDKLKSYFKINSKTSEKGRSAFVIFIGYLILTCLIIGVLLFYLRTYFKEVFNSIRKLLFILIWPVLYAYAVYFIEAHTNLSTYLIPFCLVPIIIKNFYHERLALFTHIVVILIASFISQEGYEFTFLQILAGIVTILIVEETRYFNLFFQGIGFILLSYLFGFLGLSMIKEGSFSQVDWFSAIALIFNAVLLLLAYPFIPIIEKIFGFVSAITLAELADFNKPLLKRMTIEAPGTFQHSIQVANLAEAATEKIGGDSLLVKVAALYHDIGKMKSPKYFIENLGGDRNPHDTLNNFESAKVIIDHAKDGVAMAQKARLPKKIIDFITTHHGTTRVEYFYRNQLNDEPNREFDESLFRYPGPKPTSREQAILMIADSLEAASKSLKNPTGYDIDALVDNIIAGKIAQGQLDQAKLSFSELEVCKDTFKSLLRSINHVRIEYPKDKE